MNRILNTLKTWWSILLCEDHMWNSLAIRDGYAIHECRHCGKLYRNYGKRYERDRSPRERFQGTS